MRDRPIEYALVQAGVAATLSHKRELRESIMRTRNIQSEGGRPGMASLLLGLARPTPKVEAP